MHDSAQPLPARFPHHSETSTASRLASGGEPKGSRRLTLAECRKHLPPGHEVTDEELERVRDSLYALAEAMLG